MPTQPLAKRSTAEEIFAQGQPFERVHPLSTILDAIPALVLIVNDNRQVVYANHQAGKALGAGDTNSVLGKRPGELLRCEHAREGCDGCGTSEACAMCGAAKAIRATEDGHASVNECRIRQHPDGQALDFRVSTTPLHAGGEHFSIVALTDVSHENRRRALERIFFHDLLNTLGALSGYAQLMDGARPEDRQELSDALLRLTETMAEEIRAQRDLAAAESNDLAIRLENVEAREVLEQVAVQYRNHAVARGRKLTIGEPADSMTIRTDRRLLQRIVSNMVKNACEATAPGGEVTLRCHGEGRDAVLSVHNAGAIPRDVQLQIFHRAFSTRGVGRGLGTYSMKLLGEHYLSGQVWFTSNAESGTTFCLRVPTKM